jgi:hypothetical protein
VLLRTKAGVMNGFAVPTSVNGHGHGREKRKSGSEVSHSTVSTVVGGSSGAAEDIGTTAASGRVIANTTKEESPPPGRRSIARNRHLYRSRWAFCLANSRVLTTDGTRFLIIKTSFLTH